MNQSIADLMTEHGEKVAAVRKRTLELSKMSPEQVAEIEANIKGATEFPTLNAPKYNTVSLEGVVTDEKPSDAYVLRFLAGYKFDAEKAALHLLREQRWRLVDKADEIRDKAKKIGLEGVIPINIRAAAPQSCQLGLSKEGHIISLTRVGFIKPKAMMRSLTADDYVKYCFDSNEIIWDAMQRSCEQNGRLMGVVQVLDLAGLGMKHMDKAFINGYLRKAISWASERYVEYVYRTLIINAPWVFSAMYVDCVTCCFLPALLTPKSDVHCFVCRNQLENGERIFERSTAGKGPGLHRRGQVGSRSMFSVLSTGALQRRNYIVYCLSRSC